MTRRQWLRENRNLDPEGYLTGNTIPDPQWHLDRYMMAHGFSYLKAQHPVFYCNAVDFYADARIQTPQPWHLLIDQLNTHNFIFSTIHLVEPTYLFYYHMCLDNKHRMSQNDIDFWLDLKELTGFL